MHRGRAACLLVPSLAVALEPLGAVRWTGSMIYTYAQLREQHSRRKIDRWVAEERLVRAGRHLVLPGTDDAIIAALGKGLRTTCLTAARHHGIWTPPGRGRHVYGRRGHPVPRAWVDHGYHHAWPEDDPVASPALLLEHAARCVDPVDVGILAESAMHLKLLHEADVAAIRRVSPRQVQRVLAHASGLPESGSESKVRLHLLLERVPVRPQVEIEGVGRVDLLVGERWIIECDSKTHHKDKDAYVKDRGRDFNATALGYRTNRLTYEMCFPHWDVTAMWLAQVLATGEHLVPPEQWLRTRRLRREHKR